MESSDQYNFSLFTPRNLHGKKNRNVILTMLAIWAVAVFGFQFLLKVIEKPTPEKALIMFESTWASVNTSGLKATDHKTFLTSLLLVKGKNIVKPDDQKVLSKAISYVTFNIVPDSIEAAAFVTLSELQTLKTQLTMVKDEEYLKLKLTISEHIKALSVMLEPFTGIKTGSLESAILISSLNVDYPESFSDNSFQMLPAIMKLYLTHNQSGLTDIKFLGFPFHYFYTAVFLLILFVGLCIIYNILIEWRLKKQGIVE